MSDETPQLPPLAEEVARIVERASAEAVPAPVADDYDVEEMGLNYSLKEARQVQAIRAFVQTGKVTEACKAAGVSVQTWYRWKEQSPQFLHALDKAMQEATDEVEEALLAAAKNGDVQAIKMWLSAWRSARYREKQVIEVVSPDVQSRLQRQADAIVEVCRMEIADTGLRVKVVGALAHRLREVWA